MTEKFELIDEIYDMHYLFTISSLNSLTKGLQKSVQTCYPEVACLFRNGIQEVGFKKSDNQKVGGAILEKFSNPSFFPPFKQKLLDSCKTERAYFESLGEKKFQEYSNKELAQEIFRWMEAVKNVYDYGWALVFADVTGEFTQKVQSIIGSKFKNREKAGEALSILTTPENPSFMAKEQTAFYKIGQKISQQEDLVEKFKTVELEKLADYLKENAPDINEEIDEHVHQFGWIPHWYFGTGWDKKYFLSLFQSLFRQEENFEKKLAELDRKKKEIDQKRKQLLQEGRFSAQEMHWINLFKEFIDLKVYRKDILYIGCFYSRPLTQEIAKRLALSEKQVRYMMPEEIENVLVKGKPIDENILNERDKFSVLYSKDAQNHSLIGKEAKAFVEKNIAEKEIDTTVSELRGVCACPGFVKGKVKLVLHPNDMYKMQKGDVLVSVATNPDVVPAMKLAGAIVTDIGGITSHAAIVSREMQIPCVIGTETATKVLKDDEWVEVNASEGIIKRISQNSK
ncbi:MAG: PEP-utilizing enzyme [Candidatus Diapherotrites archaeon]